MRASYLHKCKPVLVSAVLFVVLTCLVHAPAFALTADESALVSLADVAVTGQQGSDQSYVSGMSISGTYALVNWTDNVNTGGVLLASKASGTWQQVVSGGGEPNASELQGYGPDSTTSTFLLANLRPLPPTSGGFEDATGSSTHNLYTERCRNDQGYFVNYQYNDPSSVLSYSAPSVQPIDPSTAVTIDVSVTSGTAVVSLLGPSGATIQQNTLTAGQTGGVGYFSPDAASGNYMVQIQGNVFGSMDPGCGIVFRTTNYTDAAWGGTLYW